MKSMILSAVLGLGALGLVGATPAKAEASWLSEYLHARFDPTYNAYPYYPGYYGDPYSAPVYDYYYAPSYSYGAYWSPPAYYYNLYPAYGYRYGHHSWHGYHGHHGYHHGGHEWHGGHSWHGGHGGHGHHR
jgi:hypothetical protein